MFYTNSQHDCLKKKINVTRKKHFVTYLIWIWKKISFFSKSILKRLAIRTIAIQTHMVRVRNCLHSVYACVSAYTWKLLSASCWTTVVDMARHDKVSQNWEAKVYVLLTSIQGCWYVWKWIEKRRIITNNNKNEYELGVTCRWHFNYRKDL